MADQLRETWERDLEQSRSHVARVQVELRAIKIAATLIQEIGVADGTGLAAALAQAHERYNESIVQPAIRAFLDISRGFWEYLNPEEGHQEMDKQSNEPEASKQTGVKVTLTGEDGNAFSILGRVRKAMRRAGVSPAIIEQYTNEATAGDYDHLLATTFQYVDVE